MSEFWLERYDIAYMFIVAFGGLAACVGLSFAGMSFVCPADCYDMPVRKQRLLGLLGLVATALLVFGLFALPFPGEQVRELWGGQ